MIQKKIKTVGGVNYAFYDIEDLTADEIEFAQYYWGKGWNSFMEILSKITPDELLVEGGFPYNMEYTEDKEPLVSYFNRGLLEYEDLIYKKRNKNS